MIKDHDALNTHLMSLVLITDTAVGSAPGSPPSTAACTLHTRCSDVSKLLMLRAQCWSRISGSADVVVCLPVMVKVTSSEAFPGSL